MEIETVEAIPIGHELDDGRALGDSRGKSGTRATTLVRVEATDGTVGWGEAFAPPRTVAAFVEEALADEIVGASPHEVESLADRALSGDLVGYHFAREGIVQSAVSGVDVALWDVRGKAAGEPVHAMLGGRRTRSVRPYASTGYFTSWDYGVREQLRDAVDEGFTAAKIKVGSDLEEDVERVAAAREVLGDDADLMVDFNGNLRPKQAIEAAEALAPYDPKWIEEPVLPQNLDGYRRIQESVDVPIAAGEAHFGRVDFERLLDEGAVDVLQPNLGRVGGLTEARRVADMATTANVAVHPHVWNSGVGVAAAVQFAASLPDYPYSEYVREAPLLEFDRSENALRDDVLVEPFDPTGGELAVPQSPGLGIDVDEAAVERYRIDD